MRRAGRRLGICLTALTVAFLVSGTGVSAVELDRDEPAAELLQDALEAKRDGDLDLAREILEYLARRHPGTSESIEANKVLRAIGPSDGAESSNDAEDITQLQRDPSDWDGLQKDFVTATGDRVFFPENSAKLGGRARSQIVMQARWLSKRPDIRVTLVGRADDGGGKEAALKLSDARANAVKNALIEAGIDGERIVIEARGSRDPLAVCRSSLCRSQNRMVETVIAVRSHPGVAVRQPYAEPENVGWRNPLER